MQKNEVKKNFWIEDKLEVDNVQETDDFAALEDPGDEEEDEFSGFFTDNTPAITSGPDDPENSLIFLPSLVPMDQRGRVKTYVKQEITLRLGQIHDALQGLRMALSRKSIIFRECHERSPLDVADSEGLQKSKSKKKKYKGLGSNSCSRWER